MVPFVLAGAVDPRRLVTGGFVPAVHRCLLHKSWNSTCLSVYWLRFCYDFVGVPSQALEQRGAVVWELVME